MDNGDLKLLEQLVDHANRHHDGHITIFKFSTNWRVGFATPEGDMRQDNDLSLLPVGKTFAEAAGAALLQPVAFYDIHEASRAKWDAFIHPLDDLADSPAAIKRRTKRSPPPKGTKRSLSRPASKGQT